MAVSARRVAFATAASLAVYWLLKSFLHAPHPALLPAAAALVAVAVGAGGKRGGPGAPPGPAAVPVFGNWLQVGNDLNHRFLARLSARYGPVFRLRLGVRNLVVVSDPRLATEVLHTQGVEFGSRPRNVVFDIFTANGADMVFTEYGDHWRRMRRVMTLPFFTARVVQQYRAMWEAEMDDVVSDLRADSAARGAGVVVRRRLQLMLYNIMYRMMFDARFDSVDDPMFVEATKFNSERSRLAQSFDYNYGDFITESNISKLPYLQAVIKETLRLHSPIPLLVPHMNLEEASLGGYTIPKGSKVVVNAWWLANNPELWEKPEEFKPERFLGEESNVDATVGGKVDFRFLPFGVGRRSCPGIILALPILALIVGKLVRSFEMVPPPGVDKLDVSEKGGQFSLHIANHSVVAFHPISP
ncbi:unnamed protein product [Triticum turgidum subsp. durum]|uniref:Uncharacterized protein n=1 Tax=Triticum turgidum subsp. durum TaxID=4567 RepID=A0A9R0ZIU0_TRITD|nr:unnamed protein product [Triticum turgidum subsp. durum]